MDWLLLVMAGLFEVVGVIGLKRVSEREQLDEQHHLDRRISRQLPIASSGDGNHLPFHRLCGVDGDRHRGGTVVGMIFFKESKKPLRLLCILGIVVCVAALRFVE